MPTGGPEGPRRDRLVRALDAVRRLARSQADDVLAHVPDAGDTATGRAVDDFVEQVGDALRALDEVVSETLRTLDAGMRGHGEETEEPGPESTGLSGAAAARDGDAAARDGAGLSRSPHRSLPRGWR